MLTIRRLLSVFLTLAMVWVWAPTLSAQESVTPSVTVGDQVVKEGAVTVAEVVAAQDGWMVIHASADGKIGPVIGHAPVKAGTNTDVTVEIDTAAGTPSLYAMLHVDEGEAGVYEFPGPDGPVVIDGKVLAPVFSVIYVGREMPSGGGEETAAPEVLPVTGGSFPDESPRNTTWLWGGLIALLMAAGALVYRRQTVG